MSRQDDSIERLVSEYLQRRVDRRQFFKRAGALGLTVGVAGSILAACGGDDDDAAPAPPEEAPAPPEEAPPEEAPAPPEEAPAPPEPAPEPPPEEAMTPQMGGTLLEGYDRDVSRSDPVNQLWWDAHSFPVQHETLFARDADATVVPMLAESWEVSDDGLTWTFTLREGLTFHSGAPVDAAAIVAAFDEFRDPGKGVNAGFWEPVQDVSEGDGGTVVVTMANPYADFTFILDNGYSAIYNRATRDELAEEYGIAASDGTGPFVLGEFIPGSHAQMDRWDAYPGSGLPFVENPGAPYVDAVRWVVLLEPATRAQEIETGSINALHGPAPQDVDRLKSNEDLIVTQFPEMSLYQLGLNFNETDLGFDDVRVRQAVSLAIDRQAIVDSVFFGQAEAAHTIVHSAWPFYDPAVEEFNNYDPEQSAALLEEAGFTGDGVRARNGTALSFETIVEADDTEQLVAQAVQQMLGDVGIEMNFTALGAEYFEQLLAGPQAYMFKQLWSNMFDASLLFSDSRFFAPACCNASFAAIPELDLAFQAWQTAGTEDELRASSSEAQIIASEQLPFVPILTPTNTWVHAKEVHGWMPFASTLYPYYNDVWLEG